jgi:hypothetical protein
MQRTCLLPVALAVLAITQNRGRLECTSRPAQTPWGVGKAGGDLSHGAEPI